MTRKILIITFFACCIFSSLQAQATDHPNIILIITDDQGIGDLGYMGNPLIKTPHLDRLAARSTRFTNFHVNPVCAPTRAALMTGKYPQKTGIYDTYNGGAIMASEEITMAEIFSQHGYQTGIFGKWHLGDNYPFRPTDQGFAHALVHRGGGIGQPGDVSNFFAGDSAYFNPVLYANEKPVKTKGYCSDVFTDGAIDFIKKAENTPFFLYLAFNAPHTPLQLPQKYYDLYTDLTLDDYKRKFRGKDNDVENMTEGNLEDAKKVYGMVTNIDDNIGRIIDVLDREKLSDNTVIIFMSDNGPQQRRFKVGYRGLKGSVYEAGVRVPFFVYNSGKRIPKNKEVHARAAHIDLLPTLVELSGIRADLPEDLDGRSLVELIKNSSVSLPERGLFTEWGRGYPVPYKNMSVHRGNYKLVAQTDYQAPIESFELYDLNTDPSEAHNLIANEKDRAIALKSELDDWMDALYAHPNNNKLFYIRIGTPHENPVELNRNDAKGASGIWTQSEVYGYWDIEVVEDGVYDFDVHFLEELSEAGNMVLKLYPYHFSLPVEPESKRYVEMKGIKLRKGTYRLEPHYAFGGKQWLPLYVSVEKN